MRRWFHGQHDWETPEAEVDLRVGGAVRVVMRDPDKDAEHGGGGHYTEIDPPNRLAFTWTWDSDDDRRDPDRDSTSRRSTASPPCASPTATCGTRNRSSPTKAAGPRASTTSGKR